MEKCTFCIHRIKQVKYTAKLEKTTVKDGDVVTACQQSCPTNAIVFGDMNDPESRVSKAFKEERTYKLLEEVNAEPAVRYQSRIRNTNKLKADSHGHKEGHHS